MKSNIINLKQAVDTIWQTTYMHEFQKEIGSPYFFLIGAGISMPQIKGSSEIIDECIEIARQMLDKEKFDEIQAESLRFSNDASKYYSFWFETAFLNKIHRQNYLKQIIETAKISAGNLLLAQILCSKRLGTTVITPNFDDKLSQALGLFGTRDIFIADNPIDNLAISAFSNKIQIAHVHGTYRFYDCCNLENEILKVAEEIGIKSASSVLEELFKHKSPIVIGYSGWEHDVIMSRLKERLSSPLACKLIWFCFNNKSHDSLPSWLKNNDDVLIVLPENKSNDLLVNQKSNFELPAYDVLSALVSKFSIEPPIIFSNPIKYYMQTIEELLPANEDIFHIGRWASRMKYLEHNMSAFDFLLKSLEEAVAKNSIEEITNSLNLISQTEGFPQNDIEYVIFDVLFPIFKAENNIYTDENSSNLFATIINLLDNKIDSISAPEKANYLLYNILYRSKDVDIYNKIIDICNNNEFLLSSKIFAMCLKSVYLTGQDKVNMLLNIIANGKNHLDDFNMAYYVIISYDFILLENHEITSEDRSTIEYIYQKYNDKTPFRKSYLQIGLKSFQSTQQLNDIISDLSKLENKFFDPLMLRSIAKIASTLTDNSQVISLCTIAVKNIDINSDLIPEAYVNISYIYLMLIQSLIKMDTYQDVPQQAKNAFQFIEKIKTEAKRRIFNIALLKCLAVIENDKNKLLEYYSCIVEASRGVDPENEINAIQNLKVLMPEDQWLSLSSGSDSYTRHISIRTMEDQAFDLFYKKEYELSAKLFLDICKAQEELFGLASKIINYVNIAYLKRKHCIKSVDVPIIDLLVRRNVDQYNAFKCINLALCYIQEIEVTLNWDNAFAEVKKINVGIESALKWWNNIEIVGEEEHYLVSCILYMANKVTLKQVNLTKTKLKAIIKKWKIPSSFLENN